MILIIDHGHGGVEGLASLILLNLNTKNITYVKLPLLKIYLLIYFYLSLDQWI